jgi:predicted O-methyltransferase YrrM
LNLLVTAGVSRELVKHNSITADQAARLAELITSSSPARILEIGSFVGLSAATLALIGDAEITAVDPFFPLQNGASPAAILRALLARLGVEERVTLIEGYYSAPPDARSTTAVKPIVERFAAERGPFDLILIDGDRYLASVLSDLVAARRQLRDGGTILLQGFDWKWGLEVRTAAHRFCAAHPEMRLTSSTGFGIISPASG